MQIIWRLAGLRIETSTGCLTRRLPIVRVGYLLRLPSPLRYTIDIGLADTVMPLQLFQIAALGSVGWVPQPESYYLNGGIACYHDYRTSDKRRIVLGALEEKFWQAFCVAARRPEWVRRHSDPNPQIDLIDELKTFFASMSLDECLRKVDGVDCCLTPVLNLEEATVSPQIASRNLVRRTPQSLQALFPAFVDGRPPELRSPMRSIEIGDAESIFSRHPE
jgi:alpha-methylacyl-CoA racemase